MASHDEGVVQFAWHHVDGDAPAPCVVDMLEAQRSRLFAHGLLGRDPARYGGLGFGNLSLRHPSGGFIITATQTGHRARLAPADYVHVTSWSFEHFSLESCGPSCPSSEALTHAVLYDCFPGVEAVVHVHSPLLWRSRARLNLPETALDAGYGSPAMVRSVIDAFRQRNGRNLVIMAGHEDGVVSIGNTLTEAVDQVFEALAYQGDTPDA